MKVNDGRENANYYRKMAWKFNELNRRYKQALEEIANKSEVDFGNSYANRVYNHSRKLAEQALKGESE